MGVKVHDMQYSKHLSVYVCHLETPLVYQSLKNDDLPFLARAFVNDIALCDLTVIFLFSYVYGA